MQKLAVIAMMALSFNAHAATELIVNGNFNDNADTTTATQTGWVVSSNAYFFQHHAYWEGAVNSEGTLSQTVMGARGAAVLSFDFSANSGYQSVIWNGVTLDTVYAPSTLTHYSFNVIGTGSDRLVFLGRNDPYYNTLSNVSLLAAVPEPETYGMLLAGLGVMGAVARRRKKLS